jgi:hypothetical protein
MACSNLVGVKNLVITFKNCTTGETSQPIVHKLATADIPTWKTCPFMNEKLPGGYIKQSTANAGAEMKIIRDARVPLSYYQGCATLNVQCEMFSGIVFTGVDGGVLNDTKSDSHEVDLEITFSTLDELLPPGAIASDASLF